MTHAEMLAQLRDCPEFSPQIREAAAWALDRLAEPPAVTVKPLVWHNFDAWTYWSESASGTYHVEERNGYWQVELSVGGIVHGVTATDDTTPADLEAAKAAAQADYEARILSAIDARPASAVRNEALEEAASVRVLRHEEGGSIVRAPLMPETQAAIRALKGGAK